jgi:hypothetical protein
MTYTNPYADIMEYNMNLRDTDFILAGMDDSTVIKLLWYAGGMTDLAQTVNLTDTPIQIVELFSSTIVYVVESKNDGATDVVDYSSMMLLSSLPDHHKRVLNPTFLEDVYIYTVLWSNENTMKVKVVDNTIEASIPRFNPAEGLIKEIVEITGTRFIAVSEAKYWFYALDEDLNFVWDFGISD